MLRLGVCCAARQCEIVKKAGFAYIEMNLSETASMDEAAFREARAALVANSISAEAFNVMIPGSYRLTGPDADHVAALEYLKRAYERAALLGGKVVVFGSAGARNVPEGFAAGDALLQLEAFLEQAAPIASEHKLTLCIEPLNTKESNILNTVSEAAALARRVNAPGVRALADLYHMAVDDEPMSSIKDAGTMLAHCHIANPNGRLFPKRGDAYDAKPFFDALKAINYKGRVSVEAGASDFAADCAEAFAALSALGG